MQRALAKKAGKTPVKRGRGRPRKNPFPYEAEVVPVVEQIEETPAAVEKNTPSGNEVLTAIGIRTCPNNRWVICRLDGEAIQVKVLSHRKSPKNQPYKVQHIVGQQYQEIR